MFKLARKFVGHVVPGVVRPLHVLWNQVIGFFFLVLAAIPLVSVIKEIRDPASYPKLFLTVPFTLVMGAFGISSFWKARKISRS
ncbi:MAG: hypothetical protein ACR2NN_07895 [Bryobacteraceae bacterium]